MADDATQLPVTTTATILANPNPVLPTIPIPILPGINSSEFKITILGNVLGILLSYNIIKDYETTQVIGGIVLLVASNLGYITSRTVVKCKYLSLHQSHHS